MLNLRIIILSVVLIFALTVIGYFTVAPTHTITTESSSASYIAVRDSSLSIQELRDVLNGRYERRCCGQPY